MLWNFEKFLVGRDGKVIARFAPDVAADDVRLRDAIEAALVARAKRANPGWHLPEENPAEAGFFMHGLQRSVAPVRHRHRIHGDRRIGIVMAAVALAAQVVLDLVVAALHPRIAHQRVLVHGGVAQIIDRQQLCAGVDQLQALQADADLVFSMRRIGDNGMSPARPNTSRTVRGPKNGSST